MKKLAALALLALATAGGAAAYGIGTVWLQPGKCTTVAKTRVCARPAKTVTVAPIPNAPVTFTGNGSVSLAPFTLKTAGSVSWTWDGGSGYGGSIFVNDDAQHNVVLLSQAKTGKSYLLAGVHQFSVSADGNWTLTVG